MLKVLELSKKMNQKQILSNITLTIPKGSIYGIIGVNGAGKTTLIRHLVGAYKGDQGYVELEEKRVYERADSKQKIVYIPDEFPNTFGDNVNEIKKLYSHIYPTFNEHRYQELMKQFKRNGLENISRYSKGMKKQVLFILALSIMPEYLIMDEPFDGLDPQIRKTIWDILIQDVTERNMTIFISSHHLQELDSMCDHIALMNEGKIVFEKGLEDLKGHFHKIQLVTNTAEDMYAIEKQIKVMNHTMLGKIHTLIVEGKITEIEEKINQYHPIINETLPLTLEEIFLYTLGGMSDELKEVMG